MQSFIKNSAQAVAREVAKIGRGLKKLRFFKFADLRRFMAVISTREKIILAVLLAIIVLDLIGASGGYYLSHTKIVAASGGGYSEGMVGQPRYINPLLAQSDADKDLVRLVYSGLYKYDNNKIVPDLADAMPLISQDQKQYTIRLKQNLKWQDGEPLKADDVVFTFSVLQNPSYNSPTAKLWHNIKVEKIDDLTVRFTNRDISSPILSNLNLGILPQHIWLQTGPADFASSKYNLEPVGSGPFTVKEISKSLSGIITATTLNAFAGYQPRPAYINQVTLTFYVNNTDLITALHSHEVDAIGFVPFNQDIFVDQNKTKLQLTQTPVNQYQGVFLNLAKSPAVLGDRAVREAMAKSTDRNQLINNVYDRLAQPAYTPILPGQLGYNPSAAEQNSFDLNAANALLDAAGWKKGADGIRLKGKTRLQFTLTTSDFSFNQKSAEELKRQWAKIGMDVIVNIAATSDLEKNYIHPRNYEALLFSEGNGFDPDPFVFWHSSQSNDPGLNFSEYKNTAIDALISKARNTFNTDIRSQDYIQFQTIFNQDLPAIILDQGVFVYQSQPRIKLAGLNELANPEDRFYDIVQWYINTKRVWK